MSSAQYPITETTLVIGTIDYKVMCPGDSTVLSELASIVIRQMRDSGELAGFTLNMVVAKIYIYCIIDTSNAIHTHHKYTYNKLSGGTNVNSKVDLWIEQHSEDMIKDLQKLVSFKSVNHAELAQPGAPFRRSV